MKPSSITRLCHTPSWSDNRAWCRRW